jgi:arginine/lysine/ornithine decarboxylase
MDTPICDFVRRYAAGCTLRLHMPGHKGAGPLGFEQLDITEISGADSLYEARGIIAKSEENASSLFGCPTFYSTEGSSQCIRAMLYLCLLHGKRIGRRSLIAAGRNAHKVLLSAAALLDFDIEWLYPEGAGSYLASEISADYLDRTLSELSEKPVAVYVTSPDYLGNMLDIASLADVAHRHGCLLIVDNAHGAYLKFLPTSLHPMDLGADLCCDSAHKTLPALTGGAYLHTSPRLSGQAKNALALFGSTSPSYLILQSLDMANQYLAEGYRVRLAELIEDVEKCKERLYRHGYHFLGDELTKLTIDAKKYGYTGTELADLLRNANIECEFSDPDYLVLMVTPETGCNGLVKLEQALLNIPRRDAISPSAPGFHIPERIMSIRDAVLAPSESINIEACNGRVLAAATVGCPPAVPILVCGERIDEEAINAFRYYGIDTCWVISE